jgi:hypothetical protein
VSASLACPTPSVGVEGDVSLPVFVSRFFLFSSFTNPSIWSLGIVPGATSTAVIGSSFTLTATTEVTANVLTLSGHLELLSGAALVLPPGASLTLAGGLFNTSLSGNATGALQGTSVSIVVSSSGSTVLGSPVIGWSSFGKPFGASSSSKTLVLNFGSLTITNTSLQLRIDTTTSGGPRTITFSGALGLDSNTSV